MCRKLFKKSKYLGLVAAIAIFVSINLAYAVDYNSYNKVRIQILNKTTGKAKVYDIPVNNIFNFDGKLSLVVKVCYKATQRYSPEDVMFLQAVKANNISDPQAVLLNNTNLLNSANKHLADLKQSGSNGQKNDDEQASNNSNTGSQEAASTLIFSGWIFSNHPEISTLTDPTYDISIVKCLN